MISGTEEEKKIFFYINNIQLCRFLLLDSDLYVGLEYRVILVLLSVLFFWDN